MSSNKCLPFNESTMSEALNLFLEEDDSSDDKLLKFYSKCKASSTAAIAAATSSKSMMSNHDSRTGPSGMRQGMAPIRRMSMVDVASKVSSFKTQGATRNIGGHGHQHLGIKKPDIPSRTMPPPSSVGLARDPSVSRVSNMKKLGGKSAKPIHPPNASTSTHNMAPPPSVMNFLAALNSSKPNQRSPENGGNNEKTNYSSDKETSVNSVKDERDTTDTPSPSQRTRRKRQSLSDNSSTSIVRRRQSKTSYVDPNKNPFSVGDNVIVILEEEGGKFPAIIKVCEPEGTFEVRSLVSLFTFKSTTF